jgi:23S rRNA G2445 N2-methylase RlmL
MCGAGTILAEQLAVLRGPLKGKVQVFGGDRNLEALRTARANLRVFDEVPLFQWDATRLPLADGCIDRIISNPPFGKQLASPEEIGPLYRGMVAAYNRVLRPGGTAVLLVSEFAVLRDAIKMGPTKSKVNWKSVRNLRVRILGQQATLSVWRKS